MKIMKYLTMGILFIGVIVLIGCAKENPQPNPNPTGNGSGSGNSNVAMYTLRFTCTSNNPYLIEIDGNSNVVQGNTYREYYLQKGTYAWKVTQQSGYVLYPTVKTGTVNLNQDREIVFP